MRSNLEGAHQFCRVSMCLTRWQPREWFSRQLHQNLGHQFGKMYSNREDAHRSDLFNMCLIRWQPREWFFRQLHQNLGHRSGECIGRMHSNLEWAHCVCLFNMCLTRWRPRECFCRQIHQTLGRLIENRDFEQQVKCCSSLQAHQCNAQCNSFKSQVFWCLSQSIRASSRYQGWLYLGNYLGCCSLRHLKGACTQATTQRWQNLTKSLSNSIAIIATNSVVAYNWSVRF